MALFEPEAADVLGLMTGFKIHGWMIKHYLTDDELLTIDRALRAAGVPLLIEAEPLNPPDPNECQHSESFEGPYEIESLQRLANLDVHVAAIAIEQPHTYAVLSDLPGSCQYSLERTLDELKVWITDAKAIYPDVIVGSIEGLWVQFEDPGRDYATWLDGFEQATGEPLPFIHVDVDWTRPDWVDVLRDIEAEADARGVPFGVLYNGTLSNVLDSGEWLQLTAERIAEYETVGGGTPQHVNVQSWVELPDQILPDGDTEAFAHLLSRYRGTQTDVVDTSVTTAEGSSVLSGVIVDQNGAGVPGQTVTIGIVPTDGSPTTTTHTGIVPEFASEALVLVRAHVEGPKPGETDIQILDVTFVEEGGPNLVPNGDFSSGSTSWPSYGEPVGEVSFGGGQMNIEASPEEIVYVDGDRFGVTPGSEYEFTVTMGGTDASIGTVGISIAFISSTEEARDTILFAPSTIGLGTAESGPDGTFELPLGEGVESFDVVVHVSGDAVTWPVTRRTSISE